MKQITFIIVFLISTAGISQSINPQSVIKNINIGETNKVVLDLSRYNSKNRINFKNELAKQKMQIDLIHLNELTNIFTFIYNGHMDVNKILQIFETHGINHIKNSSTQLFEN